jgi:hypothetical protein
MTVYEHDVAFGFSFLRDHLKWKLACVDRVDFLNVCPRRVRSMAGESNPTGIEKTSQKYAVVTVAFSVE